MKVKFFEGKRIVIRKLSEKDLARVEDFRDFINSLVEEGAPILENKKISVQEAREELLAKLKEVKNKKTVLLLAQEDKRIVGRAEIYLSQGHREHVGILRIAVRKEYRGVGLGSYLMEKILKLAKTRLKPRPKIIRLSLFATNKRALKFYQRFGFKKVARVPGQYQVGSKLVDEIIMIKYLV